MSEPLLKPTGGADRPSVDEGRSEAALRFLVDASRLLTASLDYAATIQQIAGLAVPFLADWCTVDILEQGESRCLAAAHIEPDKEALLWQLRRRYPLTPDGPSPGSRALRGGLSILYPGFAPGELASTTRDAEHLRLVAQLSPTSAMAVPLIVQGATIGVMTLSLSRGQRDFDQTDLQLAEELASRAAVAVDHARLYQEAQAAIGARDQALAAVEAERGRLLDVFQEAPDLICVFAGPEHVYEFANPRYLQLFPNRVLIGKPVREAVPELAGQGIDELLDRIYRLGLGGTGNEVRVLLDRDEDGQLEESIFNFVYQPIRDARGPVDRIVIYALEVTEQVRARERMEGLAAEQRRLYQEATRLLELRTQFLSIAAHELRTPLTTIKGYIGLVQRALQRPAPDMARIDGLMAQLGGQIGRFEALIADLLDVSRIQLGRVELRREPLDLPGLAVEVLERFRAGAQHTFELEAPEAIVGRWDPLRLDQVLTNLLSNAVKFSAPETTVRLTVRRLGDRVEIAVADQGIGIAPEDLPTVFEPFVRGEVVREITGTGLGLFITRALIEQHGGNVALESTPGLGTTVVVSLPHIPA
ncbi:MAG TPA: ATP-binding protein [Thermomicrobiaceae bacterium]|nr:ATP-binding protein [Thermomicrobiaceae bacterium]